MLTKLKDKLFGYPWDLTDLSNASLCDIQEDSESSALAAGALAFASFGAATAIDCCGGNRLISGAFHTISAAFLITSCIYASRAEGAAGVRAERIASRFRNTEID